MAVMCTVDGCDKNARSRGWCPMHYRRWSLYGDPLKVKCKSETAVRFWSYVDKTDDCWEWRGYEDIGGYGRFWDGKREVPAHRWLYEREVEPIDGRRVFHRCENPPCVRPEHLVAR